MIAVVLAGGSGTRLWPLSRYTYPKQFIKIEGESFLSKTLKRVCFEGVKGLMIVSNKDYRFLIEEELRGIDCDGELLFEPVPKNTAIAITYAVCTLKERGTSDEEVVFVFPSDHIIKSLDAFREDVERAKELASKGFIVTFGIKPDYPETGYGYIEKGAQINEGAFKVSSFREKPSLEIAERYVDSGSFLWNSGIFGFRIDTFLSELKKHAPEIYECIGENWEFDFDCSPSISIDYALMEKTNRACVVEAGFDWSDVGSWRSFYQILDSRDENGNVTMGDVVGLDSRDSLLLSGGRLLVTIGVKDCVVVETQDAVLVADKDKSEKVKDVVAFLKEQNRSEAIEHRTTYRPWGSYTVLEEGERYKIKRITIKPGASLSYQMHYHRSEHWIVVKGTVRVVTDKGEFMVHEDESFYVAKTQKHRLENPGKIPAEVIEVQTGEYLGEDDIVRFNDKYGRTDG